MAIPKLSLIYFPVRARGEVARMILAYADIPYTDTDCQGYFGCDFGTAKATGKLTFGQLPLLAVGDTLVPQSGAIHRYLAALANTARPGFVPADPVQAALADALHETAQDLYRIMPIVNMFRDEVWRQEKEEYFTKTLPARLPALVSMLGEKDFYCGDRYSSSSLYPPCPC